MTDEIKRSHCSLTLESQVWMADRLDIMRKKMLECMRCLDTEKVLKWWHDELQGLLEVDPDDKNYFVGLDGFFELDDPFHFIEQLFVDSYRDVSLNYQKENYEPIYTVIDPESRSYLIDGFANLFMEIDNLIEENKELKQKIKETEYENNT